MKTIIKISVSAFLLFLLIYTMGGIHSLLDLFARVDPRYLVIALIISTIDRFVMTYKWLLLLKEKGIVIPLLEGVKIYCSAMVWGIFLPSTLGADAIRAISIVRRGYDSSDVILSVLIERLIGFLCALTLGIIGFVILAKSVTLGPQYRNAFLYCAVVLFFALLLTYFLLSGNFNRIMGLKIFDKFGENAIVVRIKKIHRSYIEYQKNRMLLLLFSLMTFFEQLLPIIFTWIIAVGLQVQINLLFMAAVLPLTLLLARLPISIDGLGVFESIFALFLAMAGVKTAEAFAIAFAGRIVQTISFIPWWLYQVINTKSLMPGKITRNITIESKI